MNLAPIVLFVYNRPQHTQKTVEALKNNELAKDSDLYIFSDAAKDKSTDNDVLAVQQFIRSIEGFKSITIIERQQNLGLAKSIINGVTQIVNEFGKIIVLEDDLISSPYFLKFMNDSLVLYQDNDQVGMVHGHIYYIKNLPELFFLRKSGCLGWATWKDSWNQVSFNGDALLKEIKLKKLERDFNINNSYPFVNTLSNQIAGKNNSWAIRVQASFFLKNILTFYPAESLIQHIGYDVGTHCNNSVTGSDMDGRLSTKHIQAKSIKVIPDIDAERKLEKFFNKQNNNLLNRIVRKFKMLFKFQQNKND